MVVKVVCSSQSSFTVRSRNTLRNLPFLGPSSVIMSLSRQGRYGHL
jgi:hypothetical protein